MYIRLEYQQKDGVRKGIYQLDNCLLDDYCMELFMLPVPKLFSSSEAMKAHYDEEGNLSFWYTEKGWRKYGFYAENLVFCEEAYNLLLQEDITLLGTVIPDIAKYTVVYQDEYQIALLERELSHVIAHDFVPLRSISDWINFEFTNHLNIPVSIEQG